MLSKRMLGIVTHIKTILLVYLAILTYVYKDDISGGFIRLREILLVDSVGQGRRCRLIHKFQHIQPGHPKHVRFPLVLPQHLTQSNNRYP
jgi:hypothetical protein